MDQSQRQLAEHMRKLSQLYKEVSDQTISRDEAAVRLSFLKAEQQKLREAGIVPLNMRVAQEDDGMMRKFTPRRTRSVYRSTGHELNFKCQCARCVRLYTITLADRDLLRDLKITWGKTTEEGEIPQTK